MKILLRAALILLPAAALAQKGPVRSLKSELHEVRAEPFRQTVPAVGTLRANESVTLVPEVSRRLVRIAVEEGSEVNKGDLLFKLDDADVLAVLGEIDARLQLAGTTKRRVDELIESRAISQQEFDSSTSALKLLEAQRATQEVELARTEIRAPFSGRVGTRLVSVGAFVTPSTPLITLQDLSRIKVDFPLPERYSAQIEPGRKFTFTVAGNGHVFDGVVTVVEPSVDPATRSLQVRGVCESPAGLRPGGFAEVSLTLDAGANGFMIPSQAVVPSQRGQGVYLVRDGRAELVPVEVGIRTADKVQILRGVQAGDRIATTNLLKMRPGVAIEPVTSDAAAEP